MNPDWSSIRSHYETTGEPLRTVAERFSVPFSTLGKRAVREKWQRSVPQNGNTDGDSNGNRPALFPEIGNKNGNKHGNSEVLFPENGNNLGNKPALFPSDGNKNGNKNVNNGSLFPPVGNKLVPTNGNNFSIPAAINDWDRLTAARFYLEDLKWAVHHLYPPDKGEEKERGKKPWCKGWRDHKAADVTLDDLNKVFGAATSNNVGVVVRPPFVAVDLDSKADSGESVRAWLAEHPQLADVPRERTGGGSHLHFICRDLPLHLLKARKAPSAQINEKVTAELYVNGLNLVVAPSVHKSGHRYIWEVTGPVPEVRWADLNALFGFEKPEEKKDASAKSAGKQKRWWTVFKGDLASLDILALFRSAELLGECIDPDESKWAVRCPWEHEHSGELKDEAGSDTVVFASQAPAFKCLHSHCAERTMEHVCAWFENQTPGVIDKHCTMLRGEFADEALAKSELHSPWDEPAEDILRRLTRDFGEPFYFSTNRDGEREVSDFNYLYWSAQFAFENLLIYEPCANQFFTYEAGRGLWCWQTEATVRDLIAGYLLDYSRRLNQPILETRRSPERLAGMITALKARTEQREPFRRHGQVIHLANGMLHLDTHPPELRAFGPRYFSLHQCPVAFDQDAHCPRFLNDLVYAAMDHEDALLLQLMGGLFLTGRNNWQKLLILTGTGGAGKGTIARILQQLVGMENVKQLRTRLLEDRFELDNLEQASLLVGSDVDGDFLSCSGAKVIKALTGGDPLTMEAKGGRKREVLGEHNILITCNDRLRVKLDGDESAWKRRLLIIEFNRAAACQIDDLDRVLLGEEGSGILNWFLLGAVRLGEVSRTRGRFPAGAAQEERIESLLAESDSLRLFVKARIERCTEDSLTTEEILSAYENYCALQEWEALARKRFDQQLGPLMMEFHRAPKRNDLKRGGSTKRGFMNVRVIETPDLNTNP